MPSPKKPLLRQRVRARWETGRARMRAVLHPWVGRILARQLRAKRVGRLAVWPEGVHAPEFEQLVSRIDTGPVHRGDRIEVFHHGTDAVAAVQAAIEGAREEILLETYILKDDHTGVGLLGLLARAAGRGVKVRVLADAAGSWFTKRKFWRRLESHGIETRLFHPLLRNFFDLFLRDHRKIIVVDRRIAFTGGMNVADEYGSARHAAGHHLWRDTHVRLEGSSAWGLAVVFNEGWTRAGGTALYLPARTEAAPVGPKTLVLNCRSGRGHAETAAVLAATMAAARQRLWIANSYFAPHPGVLDRLCAAARRGVDVRLLLAGQTDMPVVRRAGRACYARLLASGVRIFEYQPAIIHAKTVVADDYVSMIGSSNLDYRSYYLNAECNVLILDAATGQGMAGSFRQDLEHATEIERTTWSKRSRWAKWSDVLFRRLSPLL
jgi:cardiolipin synthase